MAVLLFLRPSACVTGWLLLVILSIIGVRDGGQGGSCPPPIRAVCRHEFGQRVDIIRAKHNTCLNNTNLGSVTADKGKKPRI